MVSRAVSAELCREGTQVEAFVSSPPLGSSGSQHPAWPSMSVMQAESIAMMGTMKTLLAGLWWWLVWWQRYTRGRQCLCLCVGRGSQAMSVAETEAGAGRATVAGMAAAGMAVAPTDYSISTF
jgi:hypothetical protein